MSLYLATGDPLWIRKGLGMQLVALDSSPYTDSYSCIPGSAWIDGNGGMGFMYSDLLTNAQDLTQMGQLQFAMPSFGEAMWDYGYVTLV